MQYNEETRRVAEEGRPTVSPMAIPYICAKRKIKEPPKKSLYGDRAVNLMSGLIGAGIFVVSILGLVVLMGPK